MAELADIEIISAFDVEVADVKTTVDERVMGRSGLLEAVRGVRTEFVGLCTMSRHVVLSVESLLFMTYCLDDSEASLVYADYVSVERGGKRLCELNEAERHVVRDSFDVGPVVVARMSDVLSVVEAMPECRYVAVYGVWLGLQRLGEMYHTAVPVGEVYETDLRTSGQKQFDYVNPIHASLQKEYELICTDHLRKIGAAVDVSKALECPKAEGDFVCEASVVIPVRNRRTAIADAVKSALSQKTDFAYNVIVVDNHSDDGTSDILEKLSSDNVRLFVVVPKRMDLGIGGCWNEAVMSNFCGRYAVQLDSDDLYSDEYTLQRIVDKFREYPYAMVIGSYRLVDFKFNTLPPGVIDHKEWTDDNGANNALRINGLGAPRAFNVAWLRSNPFPNVSYGEDYAAGLRATREHRIGRIFEPLYLCRRWSGNSDADLRPEQAAAHNAYKDKLRSDEIEARIAMNKGEA